MQTFYKPDIGVLGDTIPYFHGGRYHIFYLSDRRDPDSYGIGGTWEHISTTNFIDFTEHPTALYKGSEADQDVTTATGSVYTDESGLHHIFYTGINPYFRNARQREQGIMHATSPDLDTWSKIDGDLWYADEREYERHDWRDPFVFRDPDTNKVTMLVAARTARGPIHRRGVTAVLTSTDLATWTNEPQHLYMPGRYHGHECPDWFRIGDWYYLLFSEYTTRTATRYVMSRSPLGPWVAPADNLFDNRAFYAAKSAGADNGPRFLFGWNPTKVGNDDAGDWQWGGALTVHEILQNPDGTLRVRMPPSLDDAFATDATTDLETDNRIWTGGPAAVRGSAPHGHASTLGRRFPDSCLIEGTLTFEAVDGEAGILLNVDDQGDGGYFLRFAPARQSLQFGKIGGYRNWYVDHMPELDRPLPIRPGVPLHYRILVDETAVVAYVNDTVALSGRMYGRPRGRGGVYVDGVSATFTDHRIRPRIHTATTSRA